MDTQCSLWGENWFSDYLIQTSEKSGGHVIFIASLCLSCKREAPLFVRSSTVSIDLQVSKYISHYLLKGVNMPY
jgi:hypothetical protein